MNGTALQARTLGKLVGLGLGLALVARTGAAAADDVSPTGKGIVGGALLGGEVVLLGEAAFGLKPAWAYLLGGAVGAGGGAVLGWVAEKNADPHVSVYMLAGGMALVIPTTVAVLQATSYVPPEDYTEDRPPAGTPVSEPPQPGSSPAAEPGTTPQPPPPTAPAPGSMIPSGAPARVMAVAAQAPVAGSKAAPAASNSLYLHYHWSQPTPPAVPGLVQRSDDGLRFSIPAMEVRPLYSMAETAKFGVAQQQELRVTLISAVF